MSFEDFLSWNDITLKFIDLPYCTKGFAYYNGVRYLVIINLKCCYQQQRESLVHEMIHIFENHFSCRPEYEEQCEKQVHYIINELKTTYHFHFI